MARFLRNANGTAINPIRFPQYEKYDANIPNKGPFQQLPVTFMTVLLNSGSPSTCGGNRQMDDMVEEVDISNSDRIVGKVKGLATSAKVIARVNGKKVASTFTVPPAEGSLKMHTFSFHIQGMWKFLGKGDRLDFVIGERSIPIKDHGAVYIDSSEKESRARKLIIKLKSGRVFGKSGRLAGSPGKNVKWQEAMHALYLKVNKHFKEHFGHELYLAYGTLLGCVREGNFLVQDDDMDTMYVSRHLDREAVTTEFLDIAHSLIAAGFQVKSKNTVIKVTDGIHDKSIGGLFYQIDIFFGWFDKNNDFQLSFGRSGPPHRSPKRSLTPVIGKLGEYPCTIPEESEAVLGEMYGSSWRIPIQGFSHKRIMVEGYALTEQESQRTYWNNFYHHNKVAGGSTFAEFIAEKVPHAKLIVEVGAGSGRDAIFFGQLGRHVLAGDRSEEAVVFAQGVAAKAGLQPAQCRFMRADVAKLEDIEELTTQPEIKAAIKAGEEILLYMRFFLHSIEEPIQNQLISALSKNFPKGTVLAAEFRTSLDADQDKAHGTGHYRRYIDADDFLKQLEPTYRFKVEQSVQSFGLSIYKEEDPHLCRVIARRL